MKIEKVIMSSDSNALYLNFWPIVSKLWKEKFRMEPILFYIDENQDIDISEEYGTVYKMKPIEGIPVYLQCLWVRYWSFILFPDNICMISDIDMLPISKYYFIKQLYSVQNDMYVHLNPCVETYGTLPSCYHIGKGKTFKEILELHDNWEDSLKYLYSLNAGRDPGGQLSGKDQWFADEKYSSDKVYSFYKQNENRVLFIKRNGGQNGRRIDRSKWQYNLNLLKDNYYYDAHVIRPYELYKDEINNLVSYI